MPIEKFPERWPTTRGCSVTNEPPFKVNLLAIQTFKFESCSNKPEFWVTLLIVPEAVLSKKTCPEFSKLFMKNEGELVDLDEIEGRVALEGALPYPPGVFIVAPGEKWQKIDVDYFKILMGAIDKFPGFDPEIQGVYLDKDTGVTKAQGFVL